MVLAKRFEAATLALLLFVSYVLISLFVVTQVNAATDTCTWDGSSSASWSDGSNWSGCDNGGVPESGDTLVFPDSASNKTMNNNLAITPRFMQFTGDSYTLNGNAITFAGASYGLQFDGGATSNTINVNLTFPSANGFNRAGQDATSVNTINGTITYVGSGTHAWTEDGTVNFNGAQSGAASALQVYDGAHIVVNNGAANTFTTSSGIAVGSPGQTGGIYECKTATCFGAAANQVAHYEAGKILFSSTVSVSNNISLNGFDATAVNSIEVADSTAVSLTGTMNMGGDTQFAIGTSSTLQLTGNLALSDNLAVTGENITTSIFRLTNSTTGTGELSCATITCNLQNAISGYNGVIRGKSGSIIRPENGSALGSTTGNTIIESGASLVFQNLSADLTIAENLSINGSGASGVKGAISLSDSSDDVILTGNITLAGNAVIGNSLVGGDLEVNGVVSGTANLTLNAQWDGLNSATITLGGAAPNTYTGTTTLAGGTVYFEKAGAIPHNLTVEASDPVANRAHAYFYNSSNVMNDSGVLTMGDHENNHITFGEDNEVIGGLSGTGGTIQSQNGGDTVIIDQDFDITFGGSFYMDGDAVTFEKRGSGTLTLTGDYQFNFDEILFLVSEGTLVVNGNVRTTAGGGDVTVAGGVFKGTGTVGDVTTTSGKVAPGNSPGTLNVTSLTLGSGSVFEEEIAGATAGTGYDQAIVTGTATLGNATLSIVPSYTPAAGTVFTIIQAGSVSGVFNGLADGTETTVNGLKFRINYTGTTVTHTY